MSASRPCKPTARASRTSCSFRTLPNFCGKPSAGATARHRDKTGAGPRDEPARHPARLVCAYMDFIFFGRCPYTRIYTAWLSLGAGDPVFEWPMGDHSSNRIERSDGADAPAPDDSGRNPRALSVSQCESNSAGRVLGDVGLVLAVALA